MECVLVKLFTKQTVRKSIPQDEFIDHIGKAQWDQNLPDGAKKC